MKILILKGKIVIVNIMNNLEKFEMKELEFELQAETDTLK